MHWGPLPEMPGSAKTDKPSCSLNIMDDIMVIGQLQSVGKSWPLTDLEVSANLSQLEPE